MKDYSCGDSCEGEDGETKVIDLTLGRSGVWNAAEVEAICRPGGR